MARPGYLQEYAEKGWCVCRTYRGLYILNWIYRYFTEPSYRQWIVWISGVLQTGLYLDFFYYYFLAWRNNQKLSLPQ